MNTNSLNNSNIIIYNLLVAITLAFEIFLPQWVTVLTDTYLIVLRGIAGDTKQLMVIFQHQSQSDPNCCSKENAVEIPHLKVAEFDDEGSRKSPQHLHDH